MTDLTSEEAWSIIELGGMIEYCARDNHRWTTRKVQANNRRSNRFLEWDGQTKTVQEWGEHFGIDPQKIRNRLRRGWSVPEVFSTEDNRRRK